MRKTKEKFYNQQDFFKFYDQLIRETSLGKRTKKDGKRIRQNTIDNYIYCKKILLRFVTEKNFEIKLYLVNKLAKAEKEKAKKYWKKFYKEFTDYLYYDLDFYDNYVGQITKGLRTFFNYLVNECGLLIGNYHSFFYVAHEEIPIIVLNPEHLNYLIYNEELNCKLSEHLKIVKDIFIFGCTVSLRFSDLAALTTQNLHTFNNSSYIKVTAQKSGINSSVKLPDYAVAILEKYKKKQKTLLPLISKGYFNICLKQLALHLDLKEPIIKYRTKRGEKYIIFKNKEKRLHYTFADLISTHTMRRTGITTMLVLGVPTDVARKISGHKPNSKEFYRYVEYAQGYIDEHTDKAFDKIKQFKSDKDKAAA